MPGGNITDNASKIQKYQRLIGWLVIFFPIYVVLLTNNNRVIRNIGGVTGILYEIIFFVFFAVIIMLLFTMIKIMQRISVLKRK
jgi:hypothetical protein